MVGPPQARQRRAGGPERAPYYNDESKQTVLPSLNILDAAVNSRIVYEGETITSKNPIYTLGN